MSNLYDSFFQRKIITKFSIKTYLFSTKTVFFSLIMTFSFLRAADKLISLHFPLYTPHSDIIRKWILSECGV